MFCLSEFLAYFRAGRDTWIVIGYLGPRNSLGSRWVPVIREMLVGSAPLSFLQESCEWETLRLPKPGIPGDHMIHTANDTGKPTRLPGLLRQGR